MSIRCQAWVYEHSESTGNDRLVLLAIADEADDDGTNAYPGIDRIARKARVPKRTTMRCIDRLEKAGRLTVNRPESRGRGHFNTYVVRMDVAAEKGDTMAPFQEGRETVPERRGKARKGAPPYLNGDRPINPLTQDPTTTPLPPTTDLAVRVNAGVALSGTSAFEAFYAAYPRHEGKVAAAKAWAKAVKAVDGDIQRIIDGAMRYRNDPNREPAFTAHPATWLNAGRWDDESLPSRNGRTAPPSKSDQRVQEALAWARRQEGVG